MRQRLLQCQFVETAAALSGIPKKILTTWIQLGRAGRAEFVPFVEMIDKANSELAEALITPIKKAALEDGNLKAAQWLYQIRCKQREDAYNKRLIAAEEAAEDAFIEATIGTAESEEDIAAAEARALAAVGDGEAKH
jgi:phosphoribosylaminoimidazole-succinocarboxamide synthase